MAEDVAVVEDKASGACCDALKKKHLKLLDKYSKVEELKNKFRNCTTLVQEKYDVIEKENGVLRKALEEVKLQANTWKDEKELEFGRRVDLEDEVSALKEEVQLLKQNHNSAPGDAVKEIQERLNSAEDEIKHLKELLEKERERASSEKKKAEVEKKKADEALKKMEAGKKKVSEAQKAATVERKKAEENRLLLEKLKLEADAVKSKLASEKSKVEAAEKKAEVEKQRAAREKKRADLAEIKLKEQNDLAEANLKKAIFEKDRADDLNLKLDDARIRAEKLEELNNKLCSEKAIKDQAYKSKTGKDVDKLDDACMDLLKKDAQLPKWMEKLLSDKDHNINRERKHADSEKKKAKKYKELAEVQEKLALEQKHRADQLCKELESCRLMLKELQKELQEFVSVRANADNARLRTKEVVMETDTVKLLKKRLKLEKMLVKHANETAKVEALRNSMLHRELYHLKQEYLFFQQRLNFLDKSFLHGLEGTHHLGKMGNRTSMRETRSDGHQRPLVSGTDFGLDPPSRGSNQKLLQSSAINSSTASFSDRTLVGSQDRRTTSVTASDKLGEDVSNLRPTVPRLSDQRGLMYNEHAVAEVDNGIRSPIKDSDKEKRVGYSGKKRILDAVESIENSYSMGEKLHQRVLEKLSLLDGILNDQKNEHEDILKENSSGKHVRPSKRRKMSPEGMKDVHHLEDSGEPKSIVDLGVDQSDACMRASPPQRDLLKIGWHLEDGEDDQFGRNQCLPQEFDEMAACDYMKLLDLEDADDECSYRRAIAMPLSPLPPEVDIPGGEQLEVDNPEMLTYKGFPEASSNTKDNAASNSRFCIIDMEKNPTSMVSLQLQPRDDSVDLLKSKGAFLGNDNLLKQTRVAEKLGTSNLSGSGNNELGLLCESGFVSPNDCCPRYFIISSDYKDSSSIFRILQTMESCIPRCSFYNSTEMFLQGIQHALLKAEDLSMKEKVCVLFSLLLHGISEVGVSKLSDFLNDDLIQSFDSVTQNIKSALSDPVLRKMFMETCDLLELFTVIENFILQGKVFVCDEVSGSPEATHSFKANLVLNGNSVTVSEVIASAQLLVAGASLLASLCSAVGHIGFICETSCNIIQMHKFDRLLMLAILHAFAHACGSKFLSIQQYSISMTVVKSLVTFLEKQAISANSSSFGLSKFWVCGNNCPFSEGAISMEDVVSLLLEKLQNHGQYNYLPQDLLVPVLCSPNKRTVEISGLREDVLPSLTSDENLCDFTDILSLLEILSSFMVRNSSYIF
ncbi:maternal effect embryo arrest protein, partial [Striga asiatica]